MRESFPENHLQNGLENLLLTHILVQIAPMANMDELPVPPDEQGLSGSHAFSDNL